jgi:RNA polymerase sigma-70 factor, ECF subfamily
MMMSSNSLLDRLEALYRERFDSFLRVAAAVTGDLPLAYDAVQDGFAHALRSLHTFREDAPLEAWVWRIVVNAARDLRPAGQVDLVAEHPQREQPEANGGAGDLARWISNLPERQRLAIFLRYGADLDYRSIALALGVQVGTVSATIHAAHERLRPLLKEVRR